MQRQEHLVERALRHRVSICNHLSRELQHSTAAVQEATCCCTGSQTNTFSSSSPCSEFCYPIMGRPRLDSRLLRNRVGVGTRLWLLRRWVVVHIIHVPVRQQTQHTCFQPPIDTARTTAVESRPTGSLVVALDRECHTAVYSSSALLLCTATLDSIVIPTASRCCRFPFLFGVSRIHRAAVLYYSKSDSSPKRFR